MSHYHMNGAWVTAYHDNDARCGGGSHTRHDKGIRKYLREMREAKIRVTAPWLARRVGFSKHRSRFRRRRKGRA